MNGEVFCVRCGEILSVAYDADRVEPCSNLHTHECKRTRMRAIDFICSIKHVPMAFIGDKPAVASRSERARWLKNKAVIINGERPGPLDQITFPVTQLIFFPNSHRKCTMVDL